MKRLSVLLVLLVCAVFLTIGATAGAEESTGVKTAAPAKVETFKYLVISPHTPEGCLKAMDEVSAMGPGALEKFDFGCMEGDHTGYAIVRAASANEALKVVPDSLRAKARAVKLHKFTAMELKALHEKMKK